MDNGEVIQTFLHTAIFNTKQYLFQQGPTKKEEEVSAVCNEEEFYNISL